MGVKVLSKVRIYELAKHAEMTSKELIELLHKEFGIEVKNHMSVIEGEEAKIVEEFVEEMRKKKQDKNEQVVEVEKKNRRRSKIK
jgi:translation initiation factor IF-2